MKENFFLKVSHTNEEVSRNESNLQESHKRGKHQGCHISKIIGTIVEMVAVRTSQGKRTNDIPEMALTDYMCQEKKEGDDSTALKIPWMHPYKDSKTT